MNELNEQQELMLRIVNAAGGLTKEQIINLTRFVEAHTAQKVREVLDEIEKENIVEQQVCASCGLRSWNTLCVRCGSQTWSMEKIPANNNVKDKIEEIREKYQGSKS